MQQNFLCPNCWKENTSTSANCIHCGAALGNAGLLNGRCPACSYPRMPDFKFCGNCGTPLQQLCPNCGNTLDRDSRYCPRCSFFCGGGREGVK